MQEVGLHHIGAGVGAAQDGEDAAHRDVHVDVAGAVQRVKHQEVFAARVLRRDLVGQVHFLGGHASQVAGPFGALDEDLVAQHVELFLGLALHIDAGAASGVVVAHDAAQLAKGPGPGNRLAGDGNVQDQGIEVAAGVGKAAPLFNEELGQRGAVAQGHRSLS